MQGKISDFSIPEIFQLISTQGKSGALTIRGEERKTVFLFSDGMIVDVQPDRRHAKAALIGTMMVDAGHLTEGELRRLLTMQERGGRKIGEILVEKGKVSKETLTRYLYLQVKESLFHALLIKHGDYRFEVFAVRAPAWMPTPIRADVLMMEGVQFLDEYPIFRAKFPPGRFHVFRKRGARIDPKALPEVERTVWTAIDYSPDPYKVFRRACLTWFEGIKLLWSLADRGLVEFRAAPEEAVDPGRAMREEMARRSRVAWLRAAVWSVAAVIAGLWAYMVLLSPRVTLAFGAWAGFF